jgi:DNA-directed RNA polymerase subunit omega
LIDELNNPLNAELCRMALEKVGNPNVLVNLVSRRVRQLNTSGAAGSRPLVNAAANVGAADIALMEIIEDKMGWEMLEQAREELVSSRKRKRG